jgi:uncharacterized protein (UPF0332 family)
MSEAPWKVRVEKALHGADVLIAAGDYTVAVSRAYYAAFYAARAALAAEGVRTKTHSGLVSAFGQTFVQAGRVEAGIGRTLRELSEARYLADYAEEEAFGREEAERYLALARGFVEAVEQGLRPS